MRVSAFLGLLAASVVVSGSPVQESKDDEPTKVIIEKVTEVIVEECPKVTPKVFIISMVRDRNRPTSPDGGRMSSCSFA